MKGQRTTPSTSLTRRTQPTPTPRKRPCCDHVRQCHAGPSGQRPLLRCRARPAASIVTRRPAACKDSAAAFAALQGKRLFTRSVFEGKRQVVRSCVIDNKGLGQTRKNKVRARAVQGKQGRNHSEHALETLVDPVTESRNQHMIRHGGGLRSCPRCRF
jgi:hypothetical protein